MLIAILSALAALGLLLLIVLLVLFPYAIWIAHKMTAQERVPVSGHPSRLGMEWEDVTFRSWGDEVLLSGWYLPSPDDNRCIIIIQGTDHHRNDPQAQALNLGNDLVNQGFSVLLFDFRARGQSSGGRSSEGNREQWDVFGAIAFVEGRGIPVERIGLLGFSLGAGVAILVAAQEPRIPAVVSDSGFLDYMMELRNLYIGPFRLSPWFGFLVLLAGRILFKTDFSDVRPAHVVEQIEQPIFFIHGEDDPVISSEETVEMHRISNNTEDRVWIVPGAEHINVYRKNVDAYVRRVSGFFQRHIP
ncbi:MAG: alpha/beta hydrolase [Chloroflexi bacterium]|nr:alpha/beta hydrolase [Chloroflexota bacterium]